MITMMTLCLLMKKFMLGLVLVPKWTHLIPISERPRSCHFASMQSAFAAVGHDTKYAGQHDVMELFAEQGGTT